jgi:hypothetical protein
MEYYTYIGIGLIVWLFSSYFLLTKCINVSILDILLAGIAGCILGALWPLLIAGIAVGLPGYGLLRLGIKIDELTNRRKYG